MKIDTNSPEEEIGMKLKNGFMDVESAREDRELDIWYENASGEYDRRSWLLICHLVVVC